MRKQEKKSILGICSFFHDSSACLVKDGVLIAFAEEERFNRIKGTPSYPINSIRYCLEEGGLNLGDIDIVAYYVHPWHYLIKNIVVGMSNLPHSLNLFKKDATNIPLGNRITSMFRLKKVMRKVHHIVDFNPKFYYMKHCFSHAGSSFFISPFDKATIIVIDGAGDGLSTTIFRGEGNKIYLLGDKSSISSYPHNLAAFYSAFTQYLGFRVGFDEYKFMGLAAYGKPCYYNKLDNIVKLNSDYKLRLNLDCFEFFKKGKLRFYSDKMIKIFGSPRNPGDKITERHQDIAASVQKKLEDIVIRIAQRAYDITGIDKLCISGGVGLNCLMNRKILDNTPFSDIFIPPFTGDSGGSVGAAFYVWNQILNKPRNFVLKDAYFGPSFADREYKEVLTKNNLSYEYCEDITGVVAKLLSEGKIVGWFQGRMEGGPRALGNRSLLADPRRHDMKDIINLRIKKREYFRPFAPSITEEDVKNYFDIPKSSPFMVLVGNILIDKKDKIPAVVHVDGTARLQTVSRETNPLYHKLIKDFEKITGVPVLLNTSFNENEPIVCAPQDAVNCYLKTKIDALALGNFLVKKEVTNKKQKNSQIY